MRYCWQNEILTARTIRLQLTLLTFKSQSAAHCLRRMCWVWGDWYFSLPSPSCGHSTTAQAAWWCSKLNDAEFQEFPEWAEPTSWTARGSASATSNHGLSCGSQLLRLWQGSAVKMLRDYSGDVSVYIYIQYGFLYTYSTYVHIYTYTQYIYIHIHIDRVLRGGCDDIVCASLCWRTENRARKNNVFWLEWVGVGWGGRLTFICNFVR